MSRVRPPLNRPGLATGNSSSPHSSSPCKPRPGLGAKRIARSTSSRLKSASVRRVRSTTSPRGVGSWKRGRLAVRTRRSSRSRAGAAVAVLRAVTSGSTCGRALEGAKRARTTLGPWPAPTNRPHAVGCSISRSRRRLRCAPSSLRTISPTKRRRCNRCSSVPRCPPRKLRVFAASALALVDAIRRRQRRRRRRRCVAARVRPVVERGHRADVPRRGAAAHSGCRHRGSAHRRQARLGRLASASRRAATRCS